MVIVNIDYGAMVKYIDKVTYFIIIILLFLYQFDNIVDSFVVQRHPVTSVKQVILHMNFTPDVSVRPQSSVQFSCLNLKMLGVTIAIYASFP